MSIILTMVLDDDPQNKLEIYRQMVQGIRDQVTEQAETGVRVSYKSAIGTPLTEILGNLQKTIVRDPNNEYFVALFLRRTPINGRLAGEIDILYQQLKDHLKVFCFEMEVEHVELLQTTLRDFDNPPKVVRVKPQLSQKLADRIRDHLLKITASAAQSLEETRPNATINASKDDDRIPSAAINTDRPSTTEASEDEPPNEQASFEVSSRSKPIWEDRTKQANEDRMRAAEKRPPTVSARVPASIRNDELLKDVLYNYLPAPDQTVDPYAYPETECDVQEGLADSTGNWVIAGASIRGRGHQNKGTHRDDAFQIARAGNWHIMALSDGAGSAEYSRVTAHESVRVAIEAITQFAMPISQTPAQIETRMKSALEKAISEIYRTQESWNRKLNVDKKQTYCTLLLLIHQPLNNGGCVLGTTHIGDGVICGVNDEVFNLLTQGDHGADASTTHFVLSFSLEKLLKRPQTYTVNGRIDLFALMTDGIEDDLKPSTEQFVQGERMEQNAERFVRTLQQNYLSYPCWQDWGDILEDVISYERVNSNDDRTLIVLTRRPAEVSGC